MDNLKCVRYSIANCYNMLQREYKKVKHKVFLRIEGNRYCIGFEFEGKGNVLNNLKKEK